MRPDSSSLEGTPNGDQTPPDEYEPQPELTPDQSPTIVERDSVDIADTEAELELGDDDLEDLEADDGDDYAVDDEDGDDN
jgi:hypothetical protein